MVSSSQLSLSLSLSLCLCFDATNLSSDRVALRICDSMAASLMQRFGVDACVVGADRVAANGDTANKIGTYALAVLCRHHGVPFYVTAPLTTLDAAASDICKR